MSCCCCEACDICGVERMTEQQECVLSAHIAASNSGTEQQQWVLSVPLFEAAMCAWQFLPQLQVTTGSLQGAKGYG